MYVINSPQYHYQTSDSLDFYWKNTTIYVDTFQQKLLQESAGYSVGEKRTDISLPTFPLNTDGIDPSARRVLIEDFYIEKL